MSNLPSWLVESRENALRSQEWNELTSNIYDAVDQHLAQNQVQYFTDLSDAEKSLVLERAAKSLRGTGNRPVNAYENFNKRLSDTLDKSVNNDVSRLLLKDDPLETKTDLILNQICEGIIALLRKWPDQKYKLHAFLNQPLPLAIRFVAWHLYLTNANHRQKFINDLSNNPRGVLSPMDEDIKRKSDDLMRRIPSSNEMVQSRGNQSAMKAILSYHHSLFANKRDLADSEYYYAIPIVLSHHPPLPKNEKPYEKSLSILIEMYRTFLDTLPMALRQVYLNNSPNELEGWFRKVEFHLRNIDRPVYDHIRRTLYPPDAPMATNDDPYLLVLLKKCCHPWFKYMFVSALSVDPLMFVWDQYLITSDVPQFHDELLPAIAAAMIITLRDFLLKCRMPSEIEHVLQEKTDIIITRQLQSVIVRFFLKDFKDRIARSTFGPIIDPTEGRQWNSFNRDHVPQASNKPEQRMQERDKNENLLLMERRLKEEMKKRQDNEDAMQRKIQDLERELDRMRYQPQHLVQPVVQPYPVTTMPPARATTPMEKYLVQSRTTPLRSNEETPRKPPMYSPINDLIRKIAQTANKVAHGEGKNSAVLNEQTKNDIRLHKLDLKMAEKQVIGRTLQMDEWDQLPQQQKDTYSQQMLQNVKQRIQDRHKNQRK